MSCSTMLKAPRGTSELSRSSSCISSNVGSTPCTQKARISMTASSSSIRIDRDLQHRRAVLEIEVAVLGVVEVFVDELIEIRLDLPVDLFLTLRCGTASSAPEW